MTRPHADLKRGNQTLLAKEIRTKAVELHALPTSATMEISWKCNYNCKKCAYSRLHRGPDFTAMNLPEWDWDDVARFADELFPTMQFTESTLLGEPFLDKRFERLMALHRRYGVYWRPTTNGSLLTEDKLEAIGGVVDRLKCSFDAHNRETYQKLYLNDNFNKVVENLRRFSAARQSMDPYPWFRVGLVLMRSNLFSLKQYCDFAFNELGVNDVEIMALNYANDCMLDEFYWDIADEVNREIEALIEYCIAKKYRLRLAFARMPRRDGKYSDTTSRERSRRLAQEQPPADNAGYEKYSECVRSDDLAVGKECLADGYVWTNDMRQSRITADDGTPIAMCEYFTRPFFKPPTIERDGKNWIKVESCGSCSTYVFGNFKEQKFADIYNNELNQTVREFMYRKYEIPPRSGRRRAADASALIRSTTRRTTAAPTSACGSSPATTSTARRGDFSSRHGTTGALAARRRRYAAPWNAR